MIKQIKSIKLISYVNEISICGEAYVTIRLIIKVVLNLLGHLRRLLVQLAKMGVQVRLSLCLVDDKHINSIKLI